MASAGSDTGSATGSAAGSTVGGVATIAGRGSEAGVISSGSLESSWAREALELAEHGELEGQRVRVLPLLVGTVSLDDRALKQLAVRFHKHDSRGEGLHEGRVRLIPEAELEHVCHRHDVHEAVFAYSDVPHAHVMHLASRALS